MYPIVLTRSVLSSSDPVGILMSFADSLQAGVIRVGWLQQNNVWRRARANVKLSEVLMATLHIAACGLHLVGCVGARIGNGVAALEGILECDASFLWWRTGRPRAPAHSQGASAHRIAPRRIVAWIARGTEVTPSIASAARAGTAQRGRT